MCLLGPDWPDYSKKSYLKNEKELGHSENGCWRLVVAIYTPGPSIFFTLAILNGKSPSVRMSGLKRNPPYSIFGVVGAV
jgi:hypothetical protein